jgi:acid phosphatase (class A)
MMDPASQRPENPASGLRDIMPTSKLVILGLVALGAVGVTLNGYVKTPWNPSADPSAAKKSLNKLGYLSPKDLPNSIALLRPPPAAGSAEEQRDALARNAARELRDTPRYALAASDAVRLHESTAKAFQCAFGTDISIERTPELYALLSRVRLDVRAASYPAKRHFARPRPFVVHNARSCYSGDDEIVHDDGSYPSARGAVGWAYALVLAQLRPERAEAILQRGRDFGQSRVVCDQEWQSDVDAGKTVAIATLRQLAAHEEFKADLGAAREEVAAELAAGAKPSANCGRESAALAQR